MNWLDFGGQRPRLLQPCVHLMLVSAESQERLRLKDEAIQLLWLKVAKKSDPRT